MIIVRIIFRARQGKIRQLVERMKQATQNAPNRPRLLSDLSGPMNTMVMGLRHESLAAAEQFRAELFQSQQFQEDQSTMNELMESGSTELYTIEQE